MIKDSLFDIATELTLTLFNETVCKWYSIVESFISGYIIGNQEKGCTSWYINILVTPNHKKEFPSNGTRKFLFMIKSNTYQ